LELLWANASLPVLGLSGGQMSRRAPPHPDFEVAYNSRLFAIETVSYLADQTQKHGEIAADRLADLAYNFCAEREAMRGVNVYVELDKVVLPHNKRAAFIAKVVDLAEAQTAARSQYVVDTAPVTIERGDVPHIMFWDTPYDCAWTDPIDEAGARTIENKCTRAFMTDPGTTYLVIHPAAGLSQTIGDLHTLKMSKLADVVNNQNKFGAIAILNDRGQSAVMRPNNPVLYRVFNAPTYTEIFEAAHEVGTAPG
jgi:hypothetical protein